MKKLIIFLFLSYCIAGVTACGDKETSEEKGTGNIIIEELPQKTSSEETSDTHTKPEENDSPKTVIPSKEQVEAARASALEEMSEDEINRLKENIKVANMTMEKAYLNDNLFDKLSDKDNLYWNYIDLKGDIQIGQTAEGEAVTTYNRFDADNFTTLLIDMKESVNNTELTQCLEQLRL